MKLKIRQYNHMSMTSEIVEKDVKAVRVLWFCKKCTADPKGKMCYKCQNAPLEVVTDKQMIEVIQMDGWNTEIACETVDWACEIEGRERCQIGAVVGYSILIARFTDENDRLHFKFRWG